MRIGIDGIPLLRPLTGIGHYTFELALALASVAPATQFDLISSQPPPAAVAKHLNDRSKPNLNWIQTRKWRLNRYWWGVGLPLFLTRHSLDLFHGTNYEIPIWGGPPAVLTVHDLSSLLHPDKHQEPLASRARRRLPLMVKSAAMIITPTDSIKRELCLELGVDPEKVAVTPEAPRSVFKRVGPEETIESRRRLGISDDFILFVGTIEPRKNLIRLAKAYDQVRRNTAHRPQLVIAGSQGWLTDALFLYVKKAGLEADVWFTGYLADHDLRALYSSCRLFVYPSLYEGFGLPPLEAMACGAPVIASRIPAHTETLDTAACLIDPADVDEIARAIVELLEDRPAAEKFSMMGSERVKRFTWERTASGTLAVYEAVLKREPKRKS